MFPCFPSFIHWLCSFPSFIAFFYISSLSASSFFVLLVSSHFRSPLGVRFSLLFPFLSFFYCFGVILSFIPLVFFTFYTFLICNFILFSFVLLFFLFSFSAFNISFFFPPLSLVSSASFIHSSRFLSFLICNFNLFNFFFFFFAVFALCFQYFRFFFPLSSLVWSPSFIHSSRFPSFFIISKYVSSLNIFLFLLFSFSSAINISAVLLFYL